MDAIASPRRTLSQPESADRPFNSQRKVRSVLYVDDDTDICQVVQATLCLTVGLDVHVANSGLAAIGAAHQLMPDLVLMDVMMPGLDGPATLERMRQSPAIAHIPVIFLTAKVLPAEISYFLHLGAIGVIGKPFDPLTLGDQLFVLWDGAEAPPGAMPAHGAPAKVQAEVDSLTSSFLERTRGDVLRMDHMLERVRRGEISALREIGRLAHMIHGSAAIFGCPAVSAAAGSVETWVDAAVGKNGAAGCAIDGGSLEPLLEFMQRLAREAAAVQTRPGA